MSSQGGAGRGSKGGGSDKGKGTDKPAQKGAKKSEETAKKPPIPPRSEMVEEEQWKFTRTPPRGQAQARQSTETPTLKPTVLVKDEGAKIEEPMSKLTVREERAPGVATAWQQKGTVIPTPPKAPTAWGQKASPAKEVPKAPQKPASPWAPKQIPPQPREPEPQPQPKSSLITSAEEEVEPKTQFVEVFKAKFPVKKEKGNLGRPIMLRVNHYRLNLKKAFTVFQYDVEVKRLRFGEEAKKAESPVIKNKEIMRELFKKFCETYLPGEYKNKVVFNFSKNLYSLKMLPFEIQNLMEKSHEIEFQGGTFIWLIKKINQVQVDPGNYEDQVSINILDLIFTQNFNYSCVTIGRSFFTRNCLTSPLGIGLELWKGAYTSVRPSEVGLTWNLDTANAAFLLSKDLLEVAMQHYNCNLIPDLKSRIESDRDRDGKIGASFLDNFRGRDIKTATGGFRKKITSFGPDSSYKFDWKKDNVVKKVTIREYLKEHYNIDLKYPTLPCVNLGRESYLPMELCKTELTHKRNLNETETAAMIKDTAVKALDRMFYIDKWAKTSNISTDPILREYNIEINLNMIQLDGRVLDPPSIQYAQRIVETREIGSKGSWDHRNLKFKDPKPINNWVILNFNSRTRKDQVDQFHETLVRIGRIHGMNVNRALDYRELRISSERFLERDVTRVFDETKTKFPQLDMILVVLGGTSLAYKVIKTLGELKYGIITQVVDGKNVFRINDQTISNILLKINSKLGGKNFILADISRFSNLLQTLYKGPMMLFGADVTHPGPTDSKISESIAAVVGSLDPECAYYAARLYAQKTPKGQAYEMIHDLDKMVISLLKKFYEINKTFPHKIVFFRDGVSEGQFSLVLRHEMNKMREACQKISPGYKPAITFVVVQKRHHTRLFPMNKNDEHGRAQNVPPGTVVDKQIVSKDLFDFFLCSHSGIQGTSRPCRYFILHDDNDFSSNQIQILSHYLCHIYSRCPRSVSYPAPAYYAHLAAFRCRDYIRKPAQSSGGIISEEIVLHQNIREKMFFC